MKKAWSQLREALPNNKGRKKNILSLDKLKLHNLKREKHSRKKFSLGNIKKGSTETASPGGEKGGGGLRKVREQIKKKLSQEPTERKGSALKLEPLKASALEKMRLRNGAKVSQLDVEMHSSTAPQQSPKKTDNLERKNLKFGRTTKEKNTAQGSRRETTVQSF